MRAEIPTSLKHAVVVGLMGAGKTTVASGLARRLGWPYRDNDELLVSVAGATAREIDERFGRDALHRLEADGLLAALSEDAQTVVSAAASAIEDERCRIALQEPGVFVVWLRARPAQLISRVGSGPHRPILGSDPEELLIRQSLTRAPMFGLVAHLVIDAASAPPDEIVTWIETALGSAMRS